MLTAIETSIDDLIPYENNPRNNDGAVEAVAASIRAFGFKVPIIADKNNVIVAGHTRLKAAKLLGLKKVPVIKADDLTDEQVRAFRLADNKTAEIAEWDFEKLGVPYQLTWSCYEGKDKPCGVCGTCRDRAAAFAANNVKDPASEVGEA